MPTMQKPSGVILEVNPESVHYALSLGWVVVDKTQEQAEQPKKRGRPAKGAK